MSLAADNYDIVSLGLTPIKGFGMQSVDCLSIDWAGVVGDRQFFLIDSDGRLYSAKQTPAFITAWSTYDAVTGILVIGRGSGIEVTAPVTLGRPVETMFFGSRTVHGRVVDGPWSEWLSGAAGRGVQLVKADAPGAGLDVAPIALVSTASIGAIGKERDGADLDSRRFRLSITFDGREAFRESGWEGIEAEVGGAGLRFGQEVPRCAAVLPDPSDGARDVNVLKMIKEVRGIQVASDGPGLRMGIYATVTKPGSVSVNDTVRLLPGHRRRNESIDELTLRT